jgi:ABC-type branched-subunit amino acid transport system substrate-binding protein
VHRPTLSLLRTTLALLLLVVLAGCSTGEARTTPTTVPPIRATDGRLGIEADMPAGDRAALAGIDLAVAELNRAGGVLGHPVLVVDRQRADVVVTVDGLRLGGTTPETAAAAPDPTFLDRLRQIDPTVTDEAPARITYAAVLRAADAAKKANSDDRRQLAQALT